MKLRWHLMLALLAIILPALATAFFAVRSYHAATRDVLETGRLDLARALTAVVDREIDASLSALRVLAASRHLRDGNLLDFDRDAREALKQGLPWDNIILYSRDAQQLVNLRVPFGTRLPRSGAAEHVIEVARTRAARVSDMFVTAVTGGRAVQVAIPVMLEGEVRYVLGARIALDRLSDLLDRQKIPAASICSLLDRTQVIIARTRAREKFVGQRATADLVAHVTARPEGSFLASTKEGQRVYAAYSRSSLTGWTIALGVPETALTQPFTASMGAVAAIAVLVLATGIVGAFLIARRLSSGIAALAAAAPRASSGVDVRIDPLPVDELNQVSETIQELFAVADRRREIAERLATVTRMLSQSLELPRVGEAIVESVQQLLHAEMAVLYRLDDPAGDLAMVAGVGPGVRWNTRLSQREAAVGLAVRECRVISTPDVLNDSRIDWTPEARANLEASGYRAVLAAPLVVHGVPIGGLSVGATLGRVFTADEITLVELFADQAASALENGRLYEEARRRRVTAESLVDLGRIISRSLDPKEVAQQIGDSVWRLLGAEAAAVYRLEDPSGDLVALAVSGPGTPIVRGTRVPRGMGTIGRAVRDRGPIVSPDLLTDPDVILSPELRALAEQPDVRRTVLAVPLIANDRVVGALAVGQRHGWHFDEEQIRLAQLFADQAALALDHARLYEETRRRLHTSETLLAVSEAARATAAPREALRRITRLLVQAIGADTGGLLSFDALDDRAVPLAGYRVPPSLQQLISSGAPSLRHPFFERVRGLQAPLCAVDSQSDPRLRDDPWTRSFAHKSILILPVRLKDAVRAVFTIAWTQEAHSLSEEEQRLVEAIAGQAALAIDNLELVEGLHSRQRSLESLLEATRQLSSLQPIETVLHRIAEACGRLLDTSSVGFRIVEGDELVVAGTFGDAKEAMPTARLKIGESLSGLVAATGELLVVPADDPRLLASHREQMRRLGYQGSIVAPVKIGDRTLGVLTVLTRSKRGFSQEDVSMVSAFASQAATAIENARLYEEIRRAYEQLSLTQEQLTQAQKMEAIGQLAGGVAHDFNNLLTVITGRAALLREEIGDDPRLGRHVELIARTAGRAGNLTRQLLAFGRKQILQPKILDLNAVVGGIGTMLRRLISEDIDLLTKPGAARPAVKADPGQLEQVLMNLIVNARDAMPNGGRVTIETANVVVDAAHAAENAEAKVGPYVVLTVSDTGCGMDAGTRARIFEPFFTTKEPGKGTGLGLATVYGIVTQSGGHLAVASEPGRGTTFKIYLPAVADSVSAEDDALVSTLRRGSETVLLVEDEEDLRDLVAEALEASGYTLLKAADCKDAVRIAGEHAGPIDLLLTDVIMPQMSGRDLAERIQPRRPTMAVLYMSGYTHGIIGQGGVLDPSVAFLQKPFAPSTVSHKVREVLDQHHSLEVSGSRARSAEWAASRNHGGSSGR